MLSSSLFDELIAKSLEGSGLQAKLTLGSVNGNSEYDIKEIHEAVSSIGAKADNKLINEICIDEELKIISAPCYMMDVKIDEVYMNIKLAIDKLKDILD